MQMKNGRPHYCSCLVRMNHLHLQSLGAPASAAASSSSSAATSATAAAAPPVKPAAAPVAAETQSTAPAPTSKRDEWIGAADCPVATFNGWRDNYKLMSNRFISCHAVSIRVFVLVQLNTR